MHPTPRVPVLAFAFGLSAATGCVDRPVAIVRPTTEVGITETIVNDSIDKVDLVVMIDNSNSMAVNQTHITAQFATMIGALTDPKCVSPSNPAQHACNPDDPTDVRVHRPVRDLHVAVVDSDLGTPGVTNLCVEPETGDDGLFNPIHFGAAMQHHLPWTAPTASCGPNVPPIPMDGSFRPEDCSDPQEFPEWIGFLSDDATADTRARFTHDFRCNAALYVCGCGLEQQIESVWRGLIWHGASGTAFPGGDTANRGPGAEPFLRDDALLAIVLLTDEEDGSVQNCNYAEPGQPCEDKTGVYRSDWAGDSNPNNRFYLYQPGSSLDPTWPIDRYHDGVHPERGFLALKPGHPERVVFAAITGVPLDIPHRTVGDRSETDWDALLGAPGPDPNDFYARDQSQSVSGTQGGAPVTMQTGRAADCPQDLAAACYRGDAVHTYDPADPCHNPMYRAYPARRVVELARRFDQAPLCSGQPCHNGLVESICADDYEPAMADIVEKIQSRITDRCLGRPLATRRDETGPEPLTTVDCRVVETEPNDTVDCASLPGHRAALDDQHNPVITTDAHGVRHRVCEIDQVPTHADGPAAGQPVTGGEGWFYSTAAAGPGVMCQQEIAFTMSASPGAGTSTQLECIQSVSDGGTTSTMDR